MTGPSKGAAMEPRGLRGISLRHELEAASGEYQWVYLWHWAIRVMHWVAALSIVVLATTGLYIGRPYFAPGATGETPFQMGWMRFLHFSAAALLVMTAIVRVYWLIAGNKFERAAALFPVRPRDWVNLAKQVKFLLLIHPERAPRYLGHNPLQQLSYTGLYLLALVSVVTGFALYGQSNPDGLIFRVFGWLGPALGGMQNVRFLHHVLTWLFLAFIPIHVYLAIRSDVLERGGAISSIITGGRFVPRRHHYVDE
ncbi:MAG TPA: Ni/Fe-hydrogenase, b-type cytochrome subunit [Gemmatimonadales bacterium]|nr:Ni/Fe-hydrogenase, b-type cytochrome subunit [Gemmatimonadales bacterium]